MDADGYPTEEELMQVETWAPADFEGLMVFIWERWAYADIGHWSSYTKNNDFNEPVTHYEISTAGWSGNEDLINALHRNQLFWMMCWVQSRRGGHYIFEVKQ